MPKKGYKQTEEHRKKLRKAKFQKGHKIGLGRHLSEETRKKLSKAHQERKKKLGYINSPKTRKKLSEAIKRSYIQYPYLKKIRSERFRKEKHPNWKGGITPLQFQIRNSHKYRQWRSDIFTRDDFTCILCGKKGCYLEADHYPKKFSIILNEYKIKILEDALNCEELWNINNGRTLCKKCHRLK